MFGRVDLSRELDRNRDKASKLSNAGILQGIEELFEADWEREIRIKDSLQIGGYNTHLPEADQLDTKRIFEIENIKSLCIRYKLRFLSSNYFKGRIPFEAISEIKMLEKKFDFELSEFKILAPASLFKLEDVNKDPLLFIPLSNGSFYLVYKWGNDLAWYQAILAFPFRNLKSLLSTVFLVSLIISLLTPLHLITSTPTVEYWSSIRILYCAWCMVFLTGILSYLWFAFYQQFSIRAWNSKFFN